MQPKISQQWAAAGGRRPTAASAAGRRRPQNLKKHDPFKGERSDVMSHHGQTCSLARAEVVTRHDSLRVANPPKPFQTNQTFKKTSKNKKQWITMNQSMI